MRCSTIATSAAVAFLSFCTASQADAQFINNPARSYGVGVDVGVGVGPGFGFYPYGYRGFYGNGMSLYGPPVPTYGPIPGTFGASDYRINQNAPFFGMGLGWFGYRSPSPRPKPNFDYNSPTDPPPFLRDLNPEDVSAPLLIEVKVPIENAIVFVNDQLTKSSGPTRMFASPPLAMNGEPYHYDIRAEWIIDGKRFSQTQQLAGKAGERVVADFTK